MKLGYRWLSDYITIPWEPAELADRLTGIGTAVDGLEPVFPRFHGVVVARVTNTDTIPGDAHLRVLTVDDGISKKTVVSGAPNIKDGMLVAYARVGAILPGAAETVGTRAFGSIISEGVVCSERELGLTDDHEGVMALDPETQTVGRDLWQELELDDTSISFDLTPNRGDCLSVFGIAREVGALVGSRIRRPEIHLLENGEPADKRLRVTIEDPEGCWRYAGRLVTGGRVRPSPWWLKHRLRSAGLRPINNAVDVTNFVMMETGQPLHAFDWSKFQTGEVRVNAAVGGEEFITLDDKPRKLPEKTVMITDGGNPVAIGGIMGGQISEVSALTADFLIESACFNPVRIRRARKKLDLNTDASQRFERGVDPNGVIYALDRAAALLSKLTGGKLLTGAVDVYPSPVAPLKLELESEWINRTLGTNLASPKMVDILASLEFGVVTGKTAVVTVPTFRPDVTKPIDLAEEVARVYGYERIPLNKRAAGMQPTHRNPKVKWETRLRDVVEGLGFNQVVCNSLVDPRQILIANARPVPLRNPLSSDMAVMRADMYGSLLTVVAHNLNRRVDSIAIYELGYTYAKGHGAEPYNETRRLALALAGDAPASGWEGKPRPYDFFDLKGALQSLSAALRIPMDLSVEAVVPLAPGESFAIKAGEKRLGEIGRVEPRVCADFDIKTPVWAAVLDVEALIAAADVRVPQYRELPRFPAAYRDMALIVDAGIPVAVLLDAIRRVGGELIESVKLFDLYTGKPIPEGKKNVAFALVYRRADRTLTDDEADNAHRAIVAALASEFGAKLRE
ncbi:MAG TPA: phenylalanine--tRNA ligase subunit beta [bacterium]|nr:phenylalanine--tRNA ligase subunit beta [bacterium]